MPILKGVRLAAAVVPVALVLGACGSSSSSAAPAASSATHAKHGGHAAQKRPGAVGVVTAFNAASITLREHNGATGTFSLSTATRVRAGKGASATTLAAGERVRVVLATGSTTKAARVVILRPQVPPAG